MSTCGEHGYQPRENKHVSETHQGAQGKPTS